MKTILSPKNLLFVVVLASIISVGVAGFLQASKFKTCQIENLTSQSIDHSKK